MRLNYRRWLVPVLLLLGLAFVIYQLISQSQSQVACTLDVKICPDGTAVGRSGPKCEFAACPSSGQGTLRGTVNIGPLCPVEPCKKDVGDIYSSRRLELKSSSDKLSIVNLNPDGSFQTRLDPGTYTINLTDCKFLGCTYALPKTITIVANQTQELNVDIDTGIR